MFDSPYELALGLLTGVVFGFLLQKGRVAKFPVIVGQFLLRDWTVLKIMGVAVLVGSIGVYALVEAGLATLHVKPAQFGGLMAGGLLFGFGLIVLGYCPGTSLAACGEGHRDAMAGVLGMFTGALLFVGLYRHFAPIIHSLGNRGESTLPAMSESSPWLWIASMVALTLFAVWLASRKQRAHSNSSAECKTAEPSGEQT